MHINFSKIPSLYWEFADFHEHEQGGGHQVRIFETIQKLLSY